MIHRKLRRFTYSEHEFAEEDGFPLSLWPQNLNSDSLAAPEIWEHIHRALLTYEEPTDVNINAKEQTTRK